MNVPWLTILTLLPLAGGLAALFIGRDRRAAVRVASMGTAFACLAISLLLLSRFDLDAAGVQFAERVTWIPTLGIEYHAGVDGVSILLLPLTAILTLVCLAIAWNMERAHQFFALVLFLEAGLFGTFTALSFFFWFLFWELSLIPACFLIWFWGGARRTEAATQFFLFTMAGSVAMLVGFAAVALAAGSFDFISLAAIRSGGTAVAAFEPGFQASDGLYLFAAVTILAGLAVKVPMMPLHSWLPLTYAEAPTPVTILLTGAMSKMGVYGLLRILLPIFPGEMRQLAVPLLWLAVITIVFSVFAALAQRDLKRILAYSSINHLGYCLLGIFAVAARPLSDVNEAAPGAALSGVVLQMFNHGLIAGALFCFVWFLERRTGARGIHEFGGLRQTAPVFCGLMGVSLFASLGLPGLNGFAGEFLIFRGALPFAGWATAIALIGLLATAVLLLNVLQRLFYGPPVARLSTFPELNRNELLVVGPLAALMLLIGVWPQVALGFVTASIEGMIRWIG